jgi:hypothetical protein
MKLFQLLLFFPLFSFGQSNSLVSCPSPTNLNVNIIRCDSVELSWVSDMATVSSRIQWDTSGFVLGSGNNLLNVSNPQLITGLHSNTSYSFYVKDSCLSDTRMWIGPFTFNTGDIGAPKASMVTSIIFTSPLAYTVLFDASLSLGSGNTYTWDFGDGNADTGISPTHDYVSDGVYNATLIVQNNCGADTTFSQVIIMKSFSTSELPLSEMRLGIYPNPATECITINWRQLTSFIEGNLKLEVYSMLGKKLLEEQLSLSSDFSKEVDVSKLEAGYYILKIGDGKSVLKTSIAHIIPE